MIGNFGYSAHIKREGKRRKLHPVPKIAHNQKFTDPKGVISEYIDYLSYILRISPDCAIARAYDGRVSIVSNDLYNDFAQILQPEKNSIAEKIYASYLSGLYDRRDEILPNGGTTVYNRYSDIPKSRNDPFFKALSASVSATMKKVLNDKTNIAGSSKVQQDDDNQISLF